MLTKLNREEIRESLRKHYPDAGNGTINNWTAQFCAFKEIQPKDWVALPRKGLARLVAAILNAQGYTTHLSPEGPDKGIDILAGAGPLGFGPPKICVQVKSGADTTDMATVNQLIGAMQNVHADQGLFVAWSGYKISVDRERAIQFFRVRLWDQQDLMEQLFTYYGRLDENIRAELPLKRIWTVATDSEE